MKVDKINSFRKMDMVNKKCVNCGKLENAKRDEKSYKKIEDNLIKNNNYNALLSYYEVRCPEGDIHDFVKGKCSKCGRLVEGKFDKVKYYNSYIKKYNLVKEEINNASTKSLRNVKDMLATKITLDKAPKYNNSLKQSNILGKLLNNIITYNQFTNIGLYENNNYTEIKLNNVNPYAIYNKETEHPMFKKQSMQLKAYIFTMIRLYNTLKFNSNVPKLPLFIRDIIEKIKVDLNQSEDNMKMNFEDFTILDNSYKYTLSDKDYANFLLEYFATKLVDIYNQPSKKYSVVHKEFVISYLKFVLDREMLFSTPVSIYEKMSKKKYAYVSDASSGDENQLMEAGSADEPFDDDNIEVYENDITKLDDAYDVEDAGDIWDID